jgi:hypothetical protein
MLHRSVWPAALCFLALWDGPSTAQPRGVRRDQAADYGWLASLDAGQAQARKTGQPLMVVMRCVP